MLSKISIDSMRSGTAPDPGPTLDSVYVPGTPGADWTDEEVHVTRMRILQVALSGNNVGNIMLLLQDELMTCEKKVL